MTPITPIFRNPSQTMRKVYVNVQLINRETILSSSSPIELFIHKLIFPYPIAENIYQVSK